jgi:hypothetical protein
MGLPSPDTPLYNHPLHVLESWLADHECERDETEKHCWHLERPSWRATLCLEETVIRVDYEYPPDQSRTLSFPYALSRKDVEQAIFGFEPPS